jgi:hypothetical protein
VDISLKDQIVKVEATTATYEDVETAIKKTGKTLVSGKVVTPGEKVEEKAEEKTEKPEEPPAPAVVA